MREEARFIKIRERKVIKARIVDNLLDTIERGMGKVEGHREDEDFLKLCERIEGKEVYLIFSCEDAFEKQDDNYWLPDYCWKAI